MFFKSMGFKAIKYDIPVYQMLNTQIRKYIYTLHLHMATSFFYIYVMATSFFYIYVMATSFFYVYVIATSFFYIYVDIYIDIYISFTNWRSVQSFYWTPFFE